MEAETPPVNSDPCVSCDTTDLASQDHHDDSLDNSIHGFNIANITVIERGCNGSATGDGSDSGVELAHCESSLVSCCSGHGHNHGKDGSGSETSSTSSRPSKRLTVVSGSGSSGGKKKVAVNEPAKTPGRGKGMPPRTSSVQDSSRSKSKDRNSKPSTPRPSTLKTSTSTSICTTPRPKPPSDPTSAKRPPRATSSTRSRTPAITPTDDGRWPSTASSLTRSFRAPSDTSKPRNTAVTDTPTDDGRWPNAVNSMTRSFRGPSDSNNAKRGPNNSSNVFGLGSSLDKYCTLPRRRRERSADNIKHGQSSASRESTPARSLPPYPAVPGSSASNAARKKLTRTKIYAEVAAQTALTMDDVERLCEGGTMHECGERANCAVQTEPREDEAVTALLNELRVQTQRVQTLETELAVTNRDKHALQEELTANMHRVMNILGNNITHPQSPQHSEEGGSDSLLELESRFETAGQIIIKQENEISELHAFCRTLQRELDASTSAHNLTLQHHRDLELETAELTDFLAAEKSTLCEALCEAEARVAQRDSELGALVRLAEQRRQESLALAARLLSLEARSRDLLLAQGGAASGAAVALTGLSHRVEQLASQLQQGYGVSDQQLDQLDDVVYHNEAYSPDPATPTPPSFLNAILTAIRSAVTTPHPTTPHSVSYPSTPSDDSPLLDSETEPCLMMDSVLEDVALPDTHSHNLVSVRGGGSSGDSLHSLSQAILHRQRSERSGAELDLPSSGEGRNLVDQVIDADNMITRLLKVLRCVQLQQDASVDTLRSELLTTRHSVERLSQDVCALSTSCVVHEHAGLEARLHDTQQQLSEARTLLQQHWRDHYQALDTALETLHGCADTVAQSPALAQLQRDLEAASFACAAAPLPPVPSPDHNANPASATNTPSLINTTA